jgi:transposase IS66-like protein
MYSLIESAKLNRINPQLYIADLLTRIGDHPARHIADLLPCVNAGEKTHRRAGAKLHHGGAPRNVALQFD